MPKEKGQADSSGDVPPAVSVKPSPFVPRNVQSVGVTYHKGSKGFQVQRRLGTTMFYGKPCFHPSELKALISHDRWLLSGGPLIPPLTKQQARDLGLNYDLGLHQAAEVLQLLEGTTGATAFSHYAMDSYRTKRLLENPPPPPPANYVEGARLPALAVEGLGPGSAPMPAWRRLPGLPTCHVVHKGTAFQVEVDLRPEEGASQWIKVFPTLEQAAVAADLFLLLGGRNDPPLTRQEARDRGLCYDLGVHSDRRVAELLQGTDPTTAFSTYHAGHRRAALGADGTAPSSSTPSKKRKQADGEKPEVPEAKKPHVKIQHLWKLTPPFPCSKEVLESPEGREAFLKEVAQWLEAHAEADSGLLPDAREIAGKVLGLGADSQRLCERINVVSELFYGDGLRGSPRLLTTKEALEWAAEEVKKLLKT